MNKDVIKDVIKDIKIRINDKEYDGYNLIEYHIDHITQEKMNYINQHSNLTFDIIFIDKDYQNYLLKKYDSVI